MSDNQKRPPLRPFWKVRVGGGDYKHSKTASVMLLRRRFCVFANVRCMFTSYHNCFFFANLEKQNATVHSFVTHAHNSKLWHNASL